MIAILCPTRGRPEQFNRMRESVDQTSLCAKVYAGTHDRRGYDFRAQSVFDYPDNLPTAHKWNNMAVNLLNDQSLKLFMLGADDMIFEAPGWDKALIDHYNALENKVHVYALQDSRDKNGTPHPIVTREYIEQMGYFLPPIFLHWFSDTWTVEIAKFNNCFTHLTDYTLRHDKPSDRGQPDETHSRIRQWGWHVRDEWVAEKCAHFLEHEKQRLALKMDRLVALQIQGAQ